MSPRLVKWKKDVCITVTVNFPQKQWQLDKSVARNSNVYPWQLTRPKIERFFFRCHNFCFVTKKNFARNYSKHPKNGKISTHTKFGIKWPPWWPFLIFLRTKSFLFARNDSKQPKKNAKFSTHNSSDKMAAMVAIFDFFGTNIFLARNDSKQHKMRKSAHTKFRTK